MVFLLGFFVKQIVVRWWTTWEAVPMPGHGDDYVHDGNAHGPSGDYGADSDTGTATVIVMAVRW